MDKINKQQLNRLKKGGYCIWNSDKYALTRKYNKFKWYIRDFKDLFVELLSGVLTIVIFPIEFIIMLFSYMPTLHKIKEDE